VLLLELARDAQRGDVLSSQEQTISINREPAPTHLPLSPSPGHGDLRDENAILGGIPIASEFRGLTDEDLTTNGVFIQATTKPS
jgi:hypothetical protein